MWFRHLLFIIILAGLAVLAFDIIGWLIKHWMRIQNAKLKKQDFDRKKRADRKIKKIKSVPTKY